MRVFGRRAAGAAVVAVLVAGTGVARGGTAVASVTTAAAAAGRVCLFDAPDGAMGLGHVGWAYRLADGSDWEYGATLQDHNWRRSGTEAQMLHDFATVNDSGGYRSYRCDDTAADDPGAADAAATAGFARPYGLITDNCLTRSIEIFKAYDRSGGLNGLGDGRWMLPNAYFNYALPGWGPETKL
ncbi:MAG: hypothetical protein HOV66_15570 [Streptomycetaceae bacterium]|nr:hypothetical protein [Streptomycetaceae bacterium]